MLRPLLLALLLTAAAADPLSQCIHVRALGNWAVGAQGGTCGYGAVGEQVAMFASNQIAAADPASYDGYPFLSASVVQAASTGLACGECFQFTGPLGDAVTVMVADLCVAANGLPCSSSTSAMPQFALADTSFNTASPDRGAGSQFLGTYRKVACPLAPSVKLGFFFNAAAEDSFPAASTSAFRLRPINHRVGVATVAIMSPNGLGSAAAPLQWLLLNRTREAPGAFEWSGVQGAVQVPLYVRMSSILGECLTSLIPVTEITPGAVYNTTLQFSSAASSAAGYGGADVSLPSCLASGVFRDVYLNAFGSFSNVGWSSAAVDGNNFVINSSTTACTSGSCLISSEAAQSNHDILWGDGCQLINISLYRNFTMSLFTSGAGCQAAGACGASIRMIRACNGLTTLSATTLTRMQPANAVKAIAYSIETSQFEPGLWSGFRVRSLFPGSDKTFSVDQVRFVSPLSNVLPNSGTANTYQRTANVPLMDTGCNPSNSPDLGLSPTPSPSFGFTGQPSPSRSVSASPSLSFGASPSPSLPPQQNSTNTTLPNGTSTTSTSGNTSFTTSDSGDGRKKRWRRTTAIIGGVIGGGVTILVILAVVFMVAVLVIWQIQKKVEESYLGPGANQKHLDPRLVEL